MIIQGSNEPLILESDESFSGSTNISVAIFSGGKKIKEWAQAEMTVSDNQLILPLSEDETMSFPPGMVAIEAKWLSGDDIKLSEVVNDNVIPRSFDKKLR